VRIIFDENQLKTADISILLVAFLPFWSDIINLHLETRHIAPLALNRPKSKTPLF